MHAAAPQLLIVLWKARGTYRGGFPGAAPEAAGGEVTFTGTLRIDDGMLAEYWANADSLLFVQQLGVGRCPPEGNPPGRGRPAIFRRPRQAGTSFGSQPSMAAGG